MSHASYYRNLPKTLEFLRTQFNKTGTVFELNGYNIVGDGTTQNLGGLLAGAPEQDFPESRARIKGSNFVDNWPWIWRSASDKGYVTAFLEDEPGMGAFTLRLKGFKNPPTDYYMLPFWKATGRRKMDQPCRGGMWDWERQLRFAFDVFSEYEDVPKFVFAFSKISHVDCPSIMSRFDDRIVEWLQKLVTLPQFENTFFFYFRITERVTESSDRRYKER